MSKAVIYCRVSTDEEIQVNALESQVREAKEAVFANHWILADEFIDEGKSGTTTKKRDEYNRLVEEMETGDFDIIVVKSQDRLMRNTREWYLFADRLAQSQKQLYFYLEDKFYTPDDALITGIKAILAEEYSRELSKKINNAHRNRQKSGSNVLLTSNTWGYDKAGKAVTINEEEAKIVRLIYDLCLQGYGSRSISKELQNRGIQSRSGGNFQETTVRRIIRNPLFKGTAVMNRFHVDFNTKKVIPMPKEEWAVHENAVPAIVSPEVWEKANERMDKRAAAGCGKKGKGRQGINPGKYELSGKIICAECGSVYWRRYRRDTKGCRIAEWACSEYVRRGRKNHTTRRGKAGERVQTGGGCDNIHIGERELLKILSRAASEVYAKPEEKITGMAVRIVSDALCLDVKKEQKELRLKKEQVLKKREGLLDKMLEGVISDELFLRKDTSLKEEQERLRERMCALQEQGKGREQKEDRIEDIKAEILRIAEEDLKVQRLMNHVGCIKVNRSWIRIHNDLSEPLHITIEGIQKDDGENETT